jgi:23S rRNA pseudouridine2604 synthase
MLSHGQRLASTATAANRMVRLSKRMSELELCSRREADRLIQAGKVLIDGNTAQLGEKVESNLTNIVVLQDLEDDMPAVVLNKPLEYVSGQAEHGHTPAIRLLTKENLAPRAGETRKRDEIFLNLTHSAQTFAPAGRLDLESTGLLIFCRSGVLAKKLVGDSGKVEKEYIVTVRKAQQLNRREREQGLTALPETTNNLKRLNKGGARLAGDLRPLRPLVAKWVERGEKLRIVMKEGRKHQIRRMLRELIGFHVVSLDRIRIGPVEIQDLAPGQWRPLEASEVASLLSSS